MMFSIPQISHVTNFLWISNQKTDDFVEGTGPENDPTFQDFEGDALDDIQAAPRQGPPAPRSQGVRSASVVVAPGQIFYATIIQKPCI